MTEKNQAVRLAAFQHGRVTFLAFEIVLRVADENSVALALSHVFDPLENLREKRIGNVGYGDQ